MTNKKPSKETVRRFNVTTTVVLDTSQFKETTDEQIKRAVQLLTESAFVKADNNILLASETLEIKEVVL